MEEAAYLHQILKGTVEGFVVLALEYFSMVKMPVSQCYGTSTVKTVSYCWHDNFIISVWEFGTVTQCCFTRDEQSLLFGGDNT